MRNEIARGKWRRGRQKLAAVAAHTESDLRVEVALRGWRIYEARGRGVPAFRIFGDKTLAAIATQRPRTDHELLGISGIGIASVKKYGHQTYRLVNDNNR